MKVEFVDPFVRAAYKVFEAIAGDTPTHGKLSLRTATFTSQPVTIVAGVNGQVEGSVLYGMSAETARNIASTMIGAQVDTMDEMALSALAELGNMITGNAITILDGSGYNVDITPPSVIRGTDVEVSTKPAAIVLPINTRCGTVEINVALQENALQKAA